MADPITGEELREVQQPLKQRYREDPDTARITLSADGTLQRLTERYCVVFQTLAGSSELSVTRETV